VLANEVAADSTWEVNWLWSLPLWMIRPLFGRLSTAVSPLDLRLGCGDRRINHFVPMRLLQRRDFVNTHHAAVADDIGGNCYGTARRADSGSPAFRSASRSFL